MMIRIICIASVFYFATLDAPILAQNQTIQETMPSEAFLEENLTGTLEKRSWSKSLQSYCAQGSEYYCLVEDKTGNEWVLEIAVKKNIARMIGKKVALKGIISTKTIENKSSQNPAEISQRPVSYDPITGESREEDFTCTVFVVKNMKLQE